MYTIKYVATILFTIFISCNYPSNQNVPTTQSVPTKTKELERNPKVDICTCLTAPGDSEFMKENSGACDEAISKEIDVANWKKVNMSIDKLTSKKFDYLVSRCSGK